MGTIKATNIEPIANNGTVTLGSSGDTFTVPSGVTVNMSNATQTGVGGNNKPSFFVSKSGNQTVSNNTYTLVTFDTESYDSNSAFSSNVFTVPSGEAGKYFFFGSARPNTSTDFSYFVLYLYKNSTREISNWERNLDYDTLTISGILDLAVGDTVSLYVKHNLGSDLSVGATDNGKTSTFGGFKLTGV